jgi:hypothetical protein
LRKTGHREERVMATVTHNGHADKNGIIARTYRDTELRTLRNMYGKGFAHEFPDHAKLSELIGRMEPSALSQLHRDFDQGVLEQKIHEAGG